jgi:hypothetical protein
MDVSERIQRLERFREDLIGWLHAQKGLMERDRLEKAIEKNKEWVKREAISTGSFKTITLLNPVSVGGGMVHDVDPFKSLTHPPYDFNLATPVLNIVDATIDVLKEALHARTVDGPAVTTGRNSAFLIMPANRSDPQLEDVVDAIKEAASRCGVAAECGGVEAAGRTSNTSLESITNAGFVIVDLTRATPDVHYEAGCARGLGKISIYIAKEGTKIDAAFSENTVVFYRNMRQLRESLVEAITALERGPKPSDRR